MSASATQGGHNELVSEQSRFLNTLASELYCKITSKILNILWRC